MEHEIQWLNFQNSYPKMKYMKSLKSFSPNYFGEKLCSSVFFAHKVGSSMKASEAVA